MLSRHAEDLFWIGRYVERAEDTARLLDVTQQSVLEAGSERTPEEIWWELLEVLFLDDVFDEMPEPDDVRRFLVSDQSNPSSIVSLIGHARENTRAVREWVSAEYWEAINALYLELRDTDFDDALDGTPYDLMRRVKASCQALTGIADSSLPRTEGYRFKVLGGAVERALITVRVVSVWQRRLGGFSGTAAFPEWVKLLKSLSGYEAYLREFRAAMRPDLVLEFLLQAEHFPRSLHYCMNLAEQQLRTIATDSVGSASLRWAGRLAAELRYAEPRQFSESDLTEALSQFEEDLLNLPLVIETDYFRPSADAALHSYRTY
ncbi:MAG: alpha-E domain-containing protein [Acidimicrobiia bacterium]|nr:alpha-E domain-containing protein [Acidimicrobiia bacterium]